MSDRRTAEVRLLHAIFGTPQSAIDAYNKGIEYATAPEDETPTYGHSDGSPESVAFWDGVMEGTRRVQRLVDALGPEVPDDHE